MSTLTPPSTPSPKPIRSKRKTKSKRKSKAGAKVPPEVQTQLNAPITVKKFLAGLRPLVEWIPIVVGLIQAVTGLRSEGPLSLALAFFAGGAIVTFLAVTFARAPLQKSGRAGVAAAITVYVALVAYLITFGGALHPLAWFLLVLWAILVLALTVIYSRSEGARRQGIVTRAQLAFYVAVFALGVGVLGLAGGAAGLAINAILAGHAFTGSSLAVEAIGVGILGAVLLVARHVVVALAMLGVGLMVAGFGAAAIAGGDELFGWSLVATGVTTVFASIFTFRLDDLWTAIGFASVAVAAFFGMAASFAQGEFVFAFAFGLVAVVLAMVTALAFAAGDGDLSDLFRHPNQTKIWARSRYVVVAASTTLLLVGSAGWFWNTVITNETAGVWSVGGITLALLSVLLCLIAALGARKDDHPGGLDDLTGAQ